MFCFYGQNVFLLILLYFPLPLYHHQQQLSMPVLSEWVLVPPTFSLVVLHFFCHLECIIALTLECVYLSFTVNKCSVHLTSVTSNNVFLIIYVQFLCNFFTCFVIIQQTSHNSSKKFLCCCLPCFFSIVQFSHPYKSIKSIGTAIILCNFKLFPCCLF